MRRRRRRLDGNRPLGDLGRGWQRFCPNGQPKWDTSARMGRTVTAGYAPNSGGVFGLAAAKMTQSLGYDIDPVTCTEFVFEGRVDRQGAA